MNSKATFILIGQLEQTPMLRYGAGERPTAVLFVVTTQPVVVGMIPERPADVQRHAVHFTGEEAGFLYRKLVVGQRLMIKASVRKKAIVPGGRNELIAHTVRILKNEAPRPDPRTDAEKEVRRSFLASLFAKARETREKEKGISQKWQ